MANWPVWRKLSASLLILIQTFYPCVALARLSLVLCVILRGGDLTLYLPVIATTAALVLVIGIGMTLMPYIILRRGSPERAWARASVHPQMRA